MTTIKELTDYNPDGTRIGQDASDKVAFYGATPVVQPAATAQSGVDTTAITAVNTTTIVTTTWQASINDVITRQAAVITLVNRLRADLVTLGAIKGSI